MPLTIHLHLLRLDRDLLDANIPSNFILLDNLLVENSRGALGENVALKLRRSLIRLHKAALQRRLILSDDGDIDIRPRSQVVKDTRLDRIAGELNGLILGQLGLPLRLEDGHGGQRAGAHSHVGKLVRGAVGVDGEEVGARRVYARDDEVGADVALVAEEVLLEEGHARHHARLAACREGVEFQLRRDERRGELGVCGGSGSRAPDLGGDVVQLFAVLVGYYGARGCSCVCCDLGVC
jgi:hypothetical protein